MSAKAYLNTWNGGTIRRVVQSKRENRPTFFDMAVQQRGSANADKAYDTKTNQAWLQARGIWNGILKKEAHHIHLTAADYDSNRRKGLVRSQIERIFAHLKQWQHYLRVRYLGLARNQLELTLKAMAYNLKRLVGILKMQHP